MILMRVNSYKVFKRYKQDFWGISKVEKTSKLSDYFVKTWFKRKRDFANRFKRYVFMIERFVSNERPSFLKPSFMSLRVLKFFYLTLIYRQFRTMASKAAKKDGLFQFHYCHSLEGRLISLVFRSIVGSSMFHALEIVKSGLVTINGVKAKFYNQVLKLGGMFSFTNTVKPLLGRNLRYRLLQKSVLLGIPRFFYFNFSFLFYFFLFYPKKDDLSFPVHLNIYRASGFQ